MNKLTPPREIFLYFQSLLKSFPSHQKRAKWQHEQMKAIITNLPPNHVCCVHDYSENHTCGHQDQIQSCYYGQTQASIHITVLHRHAVSEIDGDDSQGIVTEHLCHIPRHKA